MMTRLTVLVVLAVLQPLVSEAQSVSSYELRYYLPGATAPMQTFPLPGGSYTCNLTPVPTTVNQNPTLAQWDDPDASGRACRYVELPGGPLLTFPVGNYEASLVAINNFGTSPESTRAPFAVGNVPGTPTGLRLAR